MKRGTITINDTGVYINPLNGTVWMTQHEIADLFGTLISTVYANLRAIFKSEVLREPYVVTFTDMSVKTAWSPKFRFIIWESLQLCLTDSNLRMLRYSGNGLIRKWLRQL